MSETAAPPPDRSPHSKRAIVLRVLAAIAVAAVALVVDRVIFDDAPAHERFGSKVRTLTVQSDAIEREVQMKVVVPPKAPPRKRGLVVFLHGRGEDDRSYLIDPMFDALSDLRGRAPVIAFPFGGEASYWHNRSSGAWADYVLDDVIPRLVERFDVDPDRIAIGGISMGGYGAFNIARLDPGGFCAVGAHSPAIWESAGDAADGAFDNAADFDANDVIQAAASDPSPYEDTRLWIDAGESDPFLDADDALEQALRENGEAPIVKRSPGEHDSGYWNDNWAEYLGFYAHALRACLPDSARFDPEDRTGDDPGRLNDNRSPSTSGAPPDER